MKHAVRRIARLAATLVVAASIWACNAPFIPVPPPGHIAFTGQTVPDGAGGEKTVWTTQGGANEQASSALFFVYDSDQGAGVIQRANTDGSFTAPPMDGTRGDHVHIYFQNPKGEYSPETCRLLMDGVPDAPLCP